MCRGCSKKYHTSEIEAKMCFLYHKPDLTSEEVFEYVNLKQEYDMACYVKTLLEKENTSKGK